MQSASGTLLAAIQSKERYPLADVDADWRKDDTWSFDPGLFDDLFGDTFVGIGDLGDLSQFLTSVTIDRSLSTDLPDAAKTVAGFAAAEATLTLAGTLAGTPIVKLLGAYDNPLNTLAPRTGAPVRASLGMRTTAGAELLRAITGKIRHVALDPGDGAVTLSVIDDRERIRTPVLLPTVVANDFSTWRPGLNAQYLLDALLRANGYYASPPVRTACILSAPLSGSAWPEVGGAGFAWATDITGVTGPVRYEASASGLLAYTGVGGDSSFVSWKILAGANFNTNNGTSAFVQLRRFKAPSGTVLNLIGARNTADVQAPVASFSWWIDLDTAAHTVTVNVNRGGLSTSATVTLATLTAATEHYLAVHIAFTAAGFTVNARCDATTATPANGVIGSSTGSPNLDRIDLSATSGAQPTMTGLQVTTEAFSAAMWDDAFTPTAVLDPSLNELVATPVLDTTDPWQVAQQIAAAEQAIFGMDENGVPTFRNRDAMSGGAAVATITADPAVAPANLKERASDEAVDTVRNAVTVTAQPYTLDAFGTTIWSADEVYGVAAGGALTIPIGFDGNVYDTSAVTYHACATADGSDATVTNLVTDRDFGATGNSLVVTVRNPNAFPVYLVKNLTDPAADRGQPSLTVTGRLVRPSDNPYTTTATDPASQDPVHGYGYQPLDVEPNPFRQSAASAQQFAADLLVALKDPHPVLTGVAIVGDPRLQLADRVRVADPDGLVLDQDFWIVGIQETFDKTSGYTQSLTLRQA